jgi:hypothetical protein
MTMKNLKYLVLVFLAAIVSCSPESDRDSLERPVTADELNVTATPVAVNGQNTNRIVVENHSPILSEWTVDLGNGATLSSSKAYDTLYVTKTGTSQVKFRGFNATDSSFLEKDLSVNVDVMSYLTDDMKSRLCIGQEGAPTTLGSDIDFSKVQITVEKDKNGLNGNRIIVKNPNPVFTDWDFGGATSKKNIDSIYVLKLGEIPLKATFTKADGSKVEHDFGNIDVQTFTYKPDFLVALTGGDAGKQAWTWISAPSPCYGIGGYSTDTDPTWAQFDIGTLSYFASAVGRADEATGTMTFTITGDLTLSSGRSGTYSFDLTAGVPGWSIGKLYTSGVSVLYGHGFNQTTYIGPEVTTYDIISCTKDKLVLAAPTDDRSASYNAATFFIFGPIK